MNNKKSFILYNSYRRHFEKLPDEDVGKLIKAIFQYTEDGEEPELPPTLDMAFSFIKDNLDRDMEKWQEQKKKRQEAGRKGGLAKASNAKQSLANEAVNVNVNDNVNVNVNNISKDIGEKTPEYGNKDLNRLIKGINNNLPYKLPEDNRSRMTAHNMLKLLTKRNDKGEVKKDREFLNEDTWVNAKNFISELVGTKVNEGFGPQSWYKLYDQLKLWIANEGSFPE